MNFRDPIEDHKPLWYDQPNFREFWNAYKKDDAKVLLFVGSGLSRSAGLPDWRGLLERIRDESKVKLGSEFEEKLKTGKYAEAGSIIKKVFKQQARQKNIHPTMLNEILKKILADPEKMKQPSQAVRTLCRLKWEKIITTNYDMLIETSYKEEYHCDLTVYHPWKKKLDESKAAERFLFKIHGDIGDEMSQIVLSTEDYDELYKEGGKFEGLLQSHLDSVRLILFLGFSYEDKYFKDLFDKHYFSTDSPQQYFALFAAPGPSERKKFNQKIDQLEKNGIRYITYRNTNNRHEEFHTLLDYLHEPKKYDDKYGSKSLRKKATVILLYTGGTIGSQRNSGDHHSENELDLPKINSRFHPRLQKISGLLQQRFRQFYNTGNEFQFELKWEILPEGQQILSENATVKHWNHLIKKIEEIKYKYIDGPGFITPQYQIPSDELQPTPDAPTLRKIYDREKEEYERANRGWELTENQFLEDIEDRYIAGIVVLHGTDTLASAAAALSLGMANLPCPIVITGANRPPDEDALIEKGTIFGKSDTWRNLVTSLYFLQCFGHRFTEVFVCFGDTVHHGMNLRKTTIETAPLKRTTADNQSVEPFIFRNYSITKQYLFRLIDGIFCNNCYPIGKLPYMELIKPVYSDLRHVRQNPFREEREIVSKDLELAAATDPIRTETGFKTFHFGYSVKQIAVSPSFPFIDVKRMLDVEKGIRAILVEGYKSGTYPSIKESFFTSFMSDLYDAGIPLIIVAQYGITPTQEKYETALIRRRNIPVLRLFGMIPETALPVLCRVVENIDEARWQGGAKANNSKVKYRIRLITSELRKLFANTNNIISIEFGDVTDQQARGERISEMIGTRTDAKLHNRNLERVVAESLKGDWNKKLPASLKKGDADHDIISIPRVDFLWHMSEEIKPFEIVGSAPDGLAILAERGFERGFRGFHELQLRKAPRTDAISFFECEEEEQRYLKRQAEKMLKIAAEALEARGLAFFMKEDEISISIERKPEVGQETGRGQPLSSAQFSFTVLVERANTFLDGDEKYSVQSYSKLEEDFFKNLNRGPAEHQAEDQSEKFDGQQRLNQEHMIKLATQYEELMQKSWEHHIGSLGWYILGGFKGITCAIAWYFIFDHWSQAHERSKDAGYVRAMQQSVKCDILLGNESFLKFKMTYYGWYEHS